MQCKCIGYNKRSVFNCLYKHLINWLSICLVSSISAIIMWKAILQTTNSFEDQGEVYEQMFWLRHVKGDIMLGVRNLQVFSGVRVAQSLVFHVMSCRSLLVIFYFSFWSLYCLILLFRASGYPFVSSSLVLLFRASGYPFGVFISRSSI